MMACRKARYTLAVFTGRVHGPCPRAVDAGAQSDARVHRPWKRPMDTGVKNDTRVQGL